MSKEEIVDKIWDADGQLKMAIILNPDSSKIYESMDSYAKQQAMAFGEWLDRYSGRYKGNGIWRVGHLLNRTTEDLYTLFLTHQSI